MYYKVIKNNRVIDVLDNLVYLKWQEKHQVWLLASKKEAQAILLSDKDTVVHAKHLLNSPIPLDTVEIQGIDQYEYKQLKILNGKTPEELLDEYTLFLIEEGIL